MFRACLTACSLSTAASLSASPASTNSSPTTFTITWTGVPSPQSSDWVAQYCVGSDESLYGPWSYVSVCAGWASGACSLQLTVSDPLVQAPCATLEFRMYRDPSPYKLLFTSNPVAWNTSSGGSTTPRHVRLAYGASPQTSMHFSFTTDDGTAPAFVAYGTAPGAYTDNVTSAAVTYTAADSCGAPRAWHSPGYFHHAFLTALSPGTRYYAAPSQGGVVGPETTFMTGAPVGRASSVRAVVYADMDISGGDGAAGTAERVGARVADAGAPVDFVLHVGDLSYGEGAVGVWDSWMELIEPISSKVPYLISIGNHVRILPLSLLYLLRPSHPPHRFLRFCRSTSTAAETAPRTPLARGGSGAPPFGMAATTLRGNAACPRRAASARRKRATACFGTLFP